MRRQRYRPTKPEVWYPIPLSIRSKSVSPCPALRLPNGSFRTCVVEQPNHFSLALTLGVFLRESQCGVPINVLLVYKRPALQQAHNAWGTTLHGQHQGRRTMSIPRIYVRTLASKASAPAFSVAVDGQLTPTTGALSFVHILQS